MIACHSCFEAIFLSLDYVSKQITHRILLMRGSVA
jgi:hypothetical protein